MRIRYFEATDTLFIEFRDAPVADTRDLDENTLLDVLGGYPGKRTRWRRSCVVSLACWGYFFFIRFREEGEQDISITKF